MLLLLAIILVSSTLPTFVSGSLIVHPSHREVKVDDSTYFNCSTSLSTSYIHWHHGSKYVYAGDEIMEPYLGRFEMDINSNAGVHAYNLVLRSVRPDDAGKYSCIDDGGTGESRSAELIVLEELPSCYVSQEPAAAETNTRGNKTELISLTCKIKYHGNKSPILNLTSIGANRTSLQREPPPLVDADGDSISYTRLVEPSADFKAEHFVCQTTRSVKNQYVCSFEVNGTPNAELFRDDELNFSRSLRSSAIVYLLGLLIGKQLTV